VHYVGHSAKNAFAKCHTKNTRQRKTLGKEVFCRVPKKKHTAKRNSEHILKFEFFKMTSDGETTKTKVVDLEKL